MTQDVLQLPRWIRVCGQRWRIRLMDDTPDGDYGECRHEEREIWISRSRHRDRDHALNTLAHELTHAVFASTGWDELLKAVSTKGDAEEGLVKLIEQHLWPTFKSLGSSSLA